MSIVNNQEYTPYVKHYVPGVAAEYNATMNTLKQDYDVAQVNLDMLDEALRTVPFRTDDEAQRQELTNKYKKQIEAIASVGDLENRKYQTSKLLKGFEGDYNIYGQRYKQDQQADLEADKLRQAGHVVYKTKRPNPTFKGVDEQGLPMYNDWQNKWLNYSNIEAKADEVLKPVLAEIQKLTNSQTQDVYTDDNGNVWAVTSSGQRFNINNPKTAQEKAIYNRLKNVYLPVFEKDEYGKNYAEINRQKAMDAGLDPTKEDMFGDLGKRTSFDLLLSRLPAVAKEKIQQQLLLKGEDNNNGSGLFDWSGPLTGNNNDASISYDNPLGKQANSVLNVLTRGKGVTIPNPTVADLNAPFANAFAGLLDTPGEAQDREAAKAGLTSDQFGALRKAVKQYYKYDKNGKITNKYEAYDLGVKYLQKIAKEEQTIAFNNYRTPNKHQDGETFQKEMKYMENLSNWTKQNLATLNIYDPETGSLLNNEQRKKLAEAKKEQFDVLGIYEPQADITEYIPDEEAKDNFLTASPVVINGKRYIVGTTEADNKTNPKGYTTAKLANAFSRSKKAAVVNDKGELYGSLIPIKTASGNEIKVAQNIEFTGDGKAVPVFTIQQGETTKKFIPTTQEQERLFLGVLYDVINNNQSINSINF